MMNNPIPDLVSDELFELLNNHDLFDIIKLRNYRMRRTYYKLRSQRLRQGKVLEEMAKDYPYLQLDTIKKICTSRLV